MEEYKLPAAFGQQQSQSQRPVCVGKKGKQKVHWGIGYGTGSYVIKNLEKQLEQHKLRCDQLQQDNSHLRAKEKVLLEAISSQGGNLHFVALAALQQAGSEDLPDGMASSVAASLIQDVKVHQLLRMVGNYCSGDESYIAHCMRAACTPERIEQFKSETLESIADQLRQLTMCMAVLLQADEDAATHMRERLDSVVDAYAEIAMLMHVSADTMNFEIGTLNLETMQRQEQPESHVLRVISRLELRPEQIQHLCAAFKVYQGKSTPIVAEIHRLAQDMRLITKADMNPEGEQWPADSSTVNMEDAEQALYSTFDPLGLQQQQQQQAGQWLQLQDQAQLHQQQLQHLRSSSNSSSTSHLALTPAAAVSDCSATAGGNSTAVRPWQQFGLAQQGGLTVESTERLEQLLEQFLTSTMRLRELHRTVTFTWINTLNHRQNALNIVTSYPWFSVPLHMCKKILELHDTNAAARHPKVLY